MYKNSVFCCFKMKIQMQWHNHSLLAHISLVFLGLTNIFRKKTNDVCIVIMFNLSYCVLIFFTILFCCAISLWRFGCVFVAILSCFLSSFLMSIDQIFDTLIKNRFPVFSLREALTYYYGLTRLLAQGLYESCIRKRSSNF